MIQRRGFSLRRIAAISAALALDAAVIYVVATGLTFSGFQFIPPTVQLEFLKTRPPPVRPVVLPQLQLIKPPTPIVPPPEIEIRTPRPPPHIRVARMPRHPVMPAPVQTAGPPARLAPPRPQGITAPVSIGGHHNCEHEYPGQAVRLNQQGTTTVRFTVNTDGSVSNVYVVNSSGHETLDDAAIRCAFSWRYRPALVNGRPVTAPWTTSVHWKLWNGYVPM
jgi:periplasmic protein TonB